MKIEIDDPRVMTKYLLLFSLFNGDPQEWMTYLETRGSPSQWQDDLPFVSWLLHQEARDEDFLGDVQQLLFRGSRREH